MYAVIATTLALTGAAVAAPAATIKARAEQFGLHAFSTGGELQYWAVVNAHIGAGQNALQIQRPAAYQSDPAYLNNTELFFDLGTEYPWGVAIPEVPAGTVAQVTSKPGDGAVATGFAVADEKLTYNGSPDGFWACPVQDVFTLFYGQNPDAANLPSDECLPITLQASA
ncbi:hypothetical protein MGN70_013020 [Eutypa lata]|nr:hypothetical protein MGN70_013020 [Eutypa lata]